MFPQVNNLQDPYRWQTTHQAHFAPPAPMQVPVGSIPHPQSANNSPYRPVQHPQQAFNSPPMEQPRAHITRPPPIGFVDPNQRTSLDLTPRFPHPHHQNVGPPMGPPEHQGLSTYDAYLQVEYSVVSRQLLSNLNDTATHNTALMYCDRNGTKLWRERPTEIDWKWDHPGFVKLPFSSSNKKKGNLRWNLITEGFQQLTTYCITGNPRNVGDAMKDCILKYNFKMAQNCNFETLRDPELFGPLMQILPVIVDEALKLQSRLAEPIPFLRKGHPHTIYLSRRLACSLLANAFLCTFPDPVGNLDLPNFHFMKLFHIGEEAPARHRVKKEKIRCILEYFQKMKTHPPVNSIISYERRCDKSPPTWHKSHKPLCSVNVQTDGLIENATGKLQVDFANKYVGGGILGEGMVMEEIRFATCPELIVARLFTEVLLDNEVLVVTGTRQFCNYSGYATTFKFEGPKFHPDQQTMDDLGRESVQVVAMDALYLRKGEEYTQFQQKSVMRELNKCAVAFDIGKNKNPVATGNWGCGAFNGDPQIKFLIQWMAASEMGRPEIAYYTSSNPDQAKEIRDVQGVLKRQNVSVGRLYECLRMYEKGGNIRARGQGRIPVFEFVKHAATRNKY